MTAHLNYTAAVFDLDGTILDTLDDLAASVNRALAHEHFPERSRDEVRKSLGNGMRYLIHCSMPEGADEASEARVLDIFLADYKIHCRDATKPYPGILELLRRYRAAGGKTAVVSNKGDFAVRILIDQYFPGLFDTAVGERSGVRRKPAPDAVLTALNELGCSLRSAVYIGDSEVDFETSKNAGLDGIYVAWGFRGRAALEALGAKPVVSDMDTLANTLGLG